MKSKLLLILLLISSYTFSQTWNQVGPANIAGATDGAIAFDSSNTPYVVYTWANGNRVFVKKYDGTSWVALGGELGFVTAADAVVIKVNPVTDEPWVAYRRTSDNKINVWRYNGTSWVEEGNGRGLNANDKRLQMQFDASGNVRVSYKNSTWFLKMLTYTVSTGTWSEQTQGSASTSFTGLNDNNYDFVTYEHFFSSSDKNTGSKLVRMAVGAAPGVYQYQNVVNGDHPRKISAITGTPLIAYYNNNTNSVKVRHSGAERLNEQASTGNVLKFRKSTIDNRFYLMYSDNSSNLAFQRYNSSSASWSTLPSIGVSTSVSGFFVNMRINPVDNHLYVLYKNGSSVSVKKFTITAPINQSRIYVDENATGTNDGSSWANAYVSLKDAINDSGSATTEFWVAQGRYTPDQSSKSIPFNMYRANVTMYGGFIGTETLLSERNFRSNQTILSGDINNDDTGIDFSGVGRSDNSTRVVRISANGITLDGLVISDGHAAGTSGSTKKGSAVSKDQNVFDLTIKNSTFKNNVSYEAGAISAIFNSGGYLDVENSIFDNNLAMYGTAIYSYPNANRTLISNITNCLFTNNTTKDRGAELGFAGSGLWLRAATSNSTHTVTITNSTFAKNQDIGTRADVTERSTIGLSQGATGSLNATVANCIFYNNTDAGGLESVSIGRVHSTSGTTNLVESLGTFSNFGPTTSGYANPLFTDMPNNDFTLLSGSPAIDTGNNTEVPAVNTEDLLGNIRIFNTTVDRGCYEYGATLGIETNTISNNFTVYPNPASSILNIKMIANFKQAEIYNLQGQIVLLSTTKNIDVTNLSNGVYIINVLSTSGSSIAKRFIKQ